MAYGLTQQGDIAVEHFDAVVKPGYVNQVNIYALGAFFTAIGTVNPTVIKALATADLFRPSSRKYRDFRRFSTLCRFNATNAPLISSLRLGVKALRAPISLGSKSKQILLDSDVSAWPSVAFSCVRKHFNQPSASHL